eukprot:TRINITY_DN72506_c0_g1_i1.p1 TRINITY_DN72506_c0_g1~~TRINITY_DN72506_c0_g1_i1.p1  ORF type:complete len:351 (-),score=36.58 TRINITY_DN72506_c0_g1_i1:81-1133(-)
MRRITPRWRYARFLIVLTSVFIWNSAWKLWRVPAGSSTSRQASSLCNVMMPAMISSFMRRVAQLNSPRSSIRSCTPLRIPGAGDVGLVTPRAAKELLAFPDVFRLSEGKVELLVDGSVEAKSNAVHSVLERLHASDRVPMLRGWRNEAMSVKASVDAPVALVVERAAGPLLGIRTFGCHVNGLIVDEQGSVDKLWVSRRARTKPTYPGKLDHIVAGAISHGQSPSLTVVKECGEEASIPAELAQQAKPAGMVEYNQLDETSWGINRHVLFCYDLEMPRDFVPCANDGEVELFELWDIHDVIASLAANNDDWKPNVALVIIDMLVRRGLLKPDDVGYVDLVRSLRQTIQEI